MKKEEKYKLVVEALKKITNQSMMSLMSVKGSEEDDHLREEMHKSATLLVKLGEIDNEMELI